MKTLITALLCMLLPALLPGQSTYTWNQSGGGNWATASNWSPSRSTPANNDILVINTSGTFTITGIPTQTIGRLIISGNTQVTLAPTGSARTLTISNPALAMDIQTGSQLTLIGQNGGGTRSLTVRFTGAGNLVTIAGTLVTAITANDPGIINLNNTLTQVSGVIRNDGGTIGAASGNLQFTGAAVYTHNTDGGTVPVSSWTSASICRITGVVNNSVSGLNQSFGNLEWDCPAQASTISLNGQLNNISGTVRIVNTNSRELDLASASNSTYNLQIGGDLIIDDGSWLSISGGDNITATVTVNGDFIMTGTTANSALFDFHTRSGSSITLNKIILNINGNMDLTGGWFDLAYGDSDSPNYTELRLGGNLSVTGPALLQTGSTDNSVTNGRIIFNKAGTQTLYASTPANLAYLNYEISAGSALQLLSDLPLSSSSTSSWGGNMLVGNNATLETGNYMLSSSSGAATGQNNSFTLAAGGRINTANTAGLQFSSSAGAVSTTIALVSFSSDADYEFRGPVTGVFSTSPAANTMRNLYVNNSSGTVTMEQALNLSGSLQLVNGVLISTLTNLLALNDNATSTGGNYSPARYVDGPIRKVGNDAFTFPVGKDGIYAPASITAPAAVNAEYRAEYFRGTPPNRSNITAPGLSQISYCEYWDIEEVGPGNPVVDVSLSWSGMSPCNAAAYVNNLAALTVAHYDGSTWNSHGNNGGFSGNASQGSVTRLSVSSFSVFTLGSTSAASNPLAVKFTALKAAAENQFNRVEWTNLSESGVMYYEVERAADGMNFQPVGRIEARANNETAISYSFMDAAPLSRSFYRVTAREQDGTITRSSVVSVRRDRDNNQLLSVFPNPVTGRSFQLQFTPGAAGTQLILFNTSGQVAYTEKLPGGSTPRTQAIALPATLRAGVYYLQLAADGITRQVTLVIQ